MDNIRGKRSELMLVCDEYAFQLYPNYICGFIDDIIVNYLFAPTYNLGKYEIICQEMSNNYEKI